jgi:hypothetical protein
VPNIRREAGMFCAAVLSAVATLTFMTAFFWLQYLFEIAWSPTHWVGEVLHKAPLLLAFLSLWVGEQCFFRQIMEKRRQ